MNSPRFETDELSGLWRWPVLLNSDWSRWTDEPCAILFGETRDWNCDEAVTRTVGNLLGSGEYPNPVAFQLGRGSFLVLASHYSREQAFQLAQLVNEELANVELLPRPHDSQSSNKGTLTWGVTLAERGDWNLPRALQATIAPVERALREKRFGSINEATKTWGSEERDDFWVCSRRDPVTELKFWASTVALCCRYKDEPVTLLMGDIDRYKDFNEILGHGMGDVLLQMIAHVLRRFESNDVAAFRFGGDEFLIWSRGNSLERAKYLAEQINAQVRALEIPGVAATPEEPFGSISLTWGVVAASPRGLDLQAMIRKAQELLSQAKSQQRGSVNSERL